MHDLEIQPRDNMIIIATHGRGMWVFDAELIDKPVDAAKGAVITEKDKKVLLGSWSMESDRFPFTLAFSPKGSAVAGKMSFAMGEAELEAIAFDGETLTFKASFIMGDQVFELNGTAQIEANKMKGTLKTRMGNMDFKGEKEKK